MVVKVLDLCLVKVALEVTHLFSYDYDLRQNNKVQIDKT